MSTLPPGKPSGRFENSVADLRKKFTNLDPNQMPPKPQRPPPRPPRVNDSISTAKPEEKKEDGKLDQKLPDTIETNKERDPSPDSPREKKKPVPMKDRVEKWFGKKDTKETRSGSAPVTKNEKWIQEEKKKTKEVVKSNESGSSPEKRKKGSFIANLFKKTEQPDMEISGPSNPSGTGAQFHVELPKTETKIDTIRLEDSDDENFIEETAKREIRRTSTHSSLENLDNTPTNSNLTSKSGSMHSEEELARNPSKTSSTYSNTTQGSGDSRESKKPPEPRLEKGGWSSSYEKIKEVIKPGTMIVVKPKGVEESIFARVSLKAFENGGLMVYFLTTPFEELNEGLVDIKTELDAEKTRIRIAKNEELPFKPGTAVNVIMKDHESEPLDAIVESFEGGDFVIKSNIGKAINLKDLLEKGLIRICTPVEPPFKLGGWSTSYEEMKEFLKPSYIIAINEVGSSKKVTFARIALRAYIGGKFLVSYPTGSGKDGVQDLMDDLASGKIRVRMAKQGELPKETKFSGVAYSENKQIRSPKNLFLEDLDLQNKRKT